MPPGDPGQASPLGFFDGVFDQTLEQRKRQAVVEQHRPVELFDVEVFAQLIHRVLAELEDFLHAGFVGGEVTDVIEVEIDLLVRQTRGGTYSIDVGVDRLLSAPAVVMETGIDDQDHPLYSNPTTGAIADAWFYYIATAQFEKFDEDGNLAPWDELSDT